MLHLQPIKVEDYDFNPEKLQAQASKQERGGIGSYQSTANLIPTAAGDNYLKPQNFT